MSQVYRIKLSECVIPNGVGGPSPGGIRIRFAKRGLDRNHCALVISIHVALRATKRAWAERFTADGIVSHSTIGEISVSVSELIDNKIW